MNVKQARALKVGQRVRHTVDDIEGEVKQARPNYIHIVWSDGMETHNHPDDLAETDII